MRSLLPRITVASAALLFFLGLASAGILPSPNDPFPVERGSDTTGYVQPNSFPVERASDTTGYVQPNSTGFLINHSFEKVLVQPFGYDGFRVRTWVYRPPTGNEISLLYDPPLEGPEGGKAREMSYDTFLNGTQYAAIRNGNMIARTDGYTLTFDRVEPNGTSTVILNEYRPVKALNPRYYRWSWATSSFAAEFSFTSSPDEQVFGTGQHQDFRLNQKGQSLDLLNWKGAPKAWLTLPIRLLLCSSYIPVPVYMSNKGYLFAWNLPSEGRMEFSPLRNRFVSSETNVVDYYVTAAEPGDYDTLQQRYTAATGRAPLPPDFSLGYIQSKLRYENQTEVENIAKKFQQYGIPVAMIVIDYFNWAHQGDWGFQQDLWPDPAAMARDVKNLTGAELMVSLWPSVADDSVNYNELITQGLLAGTRDGTGVTDSFNGSYTRLIDSTNPYARKFLWDTLYKNYYQYGIHNFWIDQADGGALGEAWENNGQSPLITSIPFSRPYALYAIGSQEGAGKMYPWLHQKAIDEGQRNATKSSAEDPQCQYVSLSRSTYTGGQRHCSLVWSGDTTSVWETIRNQIPAGLSMAATGLGWWTLDIGGFQTDPTVPWSGNIDTPEYRQLFVRWLQWGTFLPFMRVHGSRACNFQDAYTCNNEPWAYGAQNTPIIKSFIELRYTLKPYIKALFTQLHQTGRMIMRPLFMDFGKTDENVPKWTAENANFTTQQYMFGPRMLIAPVTAPNVTSWKVYLPKTGQNGTKPWTDWWTNETYAGGQAINVPVNMSTIPVFFLGDRQDILSGQVF